VTLVVLALVAAVVLGVVFRGRPSTFFRPTVRRFGLMGIVLVSLFTAPLSKSTGLYVGWLAVGFLALLWFGLVNRGRPGVSLMLVGLLANIVMVVLNAGMPVSVPALERAGVPASRIPFQNEAWVEARPTKNPLREQLTTETVLPWLAESIPLALPLRPAVASPGDVLLGAGAALFVFTGLTGFGRALPEKELSVAEKKKLRKAKKKAKAEGAEAPGETSDETSSSERFDVPAIGSGVAAAVGGGPGGGAHRGAPHDDELGPDGDPALVPAAVALRDPAAEAAAAAVAAAAARAEAQQEKIKAKIKEMKKQRKQLKRQTKAVTAGAVGAEGDGPSGASLDEPGTAATEPSEDLDPAGPARTTDEVDPPVAAATATRPSRLGLSVVPPVDLDDDDDDDDLDDDDTEASKEKQELDGATPVIGARRQRNRQRREAAAASKALEKKSTRAGTPPSDRLA
jgi:hypothetical protein